MCVSIMLATSACDPMTGAAGQVADTAGQPIRGATFFLTAWEGTTNGEQTFSGAQGHFHVQLIGADGTLTVSNSAYKPASNQLSSVGVNYVDVILAPTNSSEASRIIVRPPAR
jgi:hypothetical protein